MNAIISKVSVFEAYFTYISTMLETLNAISAIEVQPEVSSACFATSTQVLGSAVYAFFAIDELAIVHVEGDGGGGEGGGGGGGGGGEGEGEGGGGEGGGCGGEATGGQPANQF